MEIFLRSLLHDSKLDFCYKSLCVQDGPKKLATTNLSIQSHTGASSIRHVFSPYLTAKSSCIKYSVRDLICDVISYCV